jgi:hypothetical protein
MKTRLAAVAFAAVLGALAGASGCAPNRASVQVQSICFPTEDCTFTSRCDERFGGTAGIAGAGTLVLYLQVENQLPNNENLDTGRLNTNDAHVTEFRIDYEGAQTNTSYVGANSWVPAGGSAVVPVGLAIFGAGEILARVRLRGYFDDGSSFESGALPVSIMAGPSACPPSPCATAASTCPPGGGSQCPVNCSGSGTGPANTFTVGGTISGLSGSGLVLATPGYADVSVAAGETSFTFTGLADGATYDVTVRQQPTGQTCTVFNGTGTVSGGNVNTISISCG